MFPTVEVRWFLPGRVPAEVEAWFEQTGGELGPVACRVDHYLCLAGEGKVGIKLREDRIEVKQRESSGKAVQLHPHVAGRREYWRKWSFALVQEGTSQDKVLIPSASWIAVEKARLLRRYRVTNAGCVVAVPPTDYPDRACDWELTQVRVEGRAWWTVGFEAFGHEPYLEQTLHTVAAQVLAAQVPPTFKAQDSLGYPEWLALLDRYRV